MAHSRNTWAVLGDGKSNSWANLNLSHDDRTPTFLNLKVLITFGEIKKFFSGLRTIFSEHTENFLNFLIHYVAIEKMLPF